MLWKKRLVFALSTSATLIIAGGAMLTVFTALTYARSCARLTGFPGLLQSVGIVSAGPCVTKIGGTVCGSGTACTTANAQPGKCTNIAAVGQPANCSCQSTTISNGLR
jgi:hypothetical protein